MCYTDYVVCYFCTGFTDIVLPSIARCAYSDSILASRYCVPVAQLCLLVKEVILMFACVRTMEMITAACMHPTMMLILLFNLPCSNVCWRNNRWLTPLIRIMECKWSACSHTGNIDSNLAQSWWHRYMQRLSHDLPLTTHIEFYSAPTTSEQHIANQAHQTQSCYHSYNVQHRYVPNWIVWLHTR